MKYLIPLLFPISAWATCMPTQEATQHLSEAYNESPTFLGSGPYNGYEAAYVVWVNQTSRSWTMTVSYMSDAGDTTCLIASGNGFRATFERSL